MAASKPPKSADAGAQKSVENGDRPSQSALGEALRANLRRRKDQARARAEQEAGRRDGVAQADASAPKRRES